MSKKKLEKKIEDNSVEIGWLSYKNGLSQVYNSGLEYSFVSKDNKQCCPFVYCKDFLQDALMAVHHQCPVNIYGFEYIAQSCEPICSEKTRIAITNAKDSKFSEKIPAMLHFLRQVERKLKLIRTTSLRVNNPPSKYAKCGVFLLEGSSRWMLSPPMISMYSLLIRIGFVHTIGDSYEKTIENVAKGTVNPYQSNDKVQIEKAKSGIEKILKYGYAKLFWKDIVKNYPKVNTSSMHNYFGIMAFSEPKNPYKQPKHWHRKIEDKAVTEKVAV